MSQMTLDTVVNMYGCDFVYLVGLDLIAAFYGCLYAGCIPITVRPPHPQNISTTLPTVKMIVEVNTQTPLYPRTGNLYTVSRYEKLDQQL